MPLRYKQFGRKKSISLSKRDLTITKVLQNTLKCNKKHKISEKYKKTGNLIASFYANITD